MTPLLYWKPIKFIPEAFYASFFTTVQKTTLWKNFPKETIISNPQLLQDLNQFKKQPLPAIIERIDTPSRKDWITLVKKALASKIEKVVLARKTTLKLSKSIHPLSLLSYLENQHPHLQHFAYCPSPSEGFIGATPETLFTLNQQLLCTEALAGTFCTNENINISSYPKEMMECLIVKREIIRQLTPITSHIKSSPQAQLKKLLHMQHLHYTIKAKINTAISIPKLTQILHPTPAMGGLPSEEALSFIDQYESFDRGLFAAPIGISSSSQADIKVGIRSALIQDDLIHLFSGAGIIQGSNPEMEWNELEAKIQPIYSLFSKSNL